MTVARGAALGAVALAVIALAVVLFGGSEKHSYTLLFQNAGQLVKDNDVQVAGRRVGRVADIQLTDDNLARVDVEVEEPVAPLRAGTSAVIRATSLSGVANRYVALTPGPSGGEELDDGAVLRLDKTRSIVDLDQLFNTLDPQARKDLQGVIRGFGAQLDRRGEQAGQSAEYFNPLLSSTRRLSQQLAGDEATLTQFIVNASRAVTALADRRDDLADLVSNTNATAGAIASESASLEQALGLLPTTLRRANTTFVNLRSTLDDLDVLVAESKPATRELAPFFRELRPLVEESRPTLRDLRRLVSRTGPNNDAIDATRLLPQLQGVATEAFRRGDAALEKAQPVLEQLRPYAPDLVGWLRDFGQGAASYDANGHYARIQPMFNAFQFSDDAGGGTLTPVAPSQRAAGLQTGNLRRCPGAATQAATDGSSPFTDHGRLGPSDCDPAMVPPGP